MSSSIEEIASSSEISAAGVEQTYATAVEANRAIEGVTQRYDELSQLA
ncbi:hypothetical protein [Sutcliffiella deserti]|nr:hypothetical protein [Sutcliffiella deserti]